MYSDKQNWYQVADEWFQEAHIQQVLEEASEKADDRKYVLGLLEKALTLKGLSHQEAAVLLQVTEPTLLHEMQHVAKQIKETIYGKRVVLFAPLYVSDYCVNNCEIGRAHV